MFCKVSHYHACGGPHVVGAWPYTYYVRVRNAMIQEWKDRADAQRRMFERDESSDDGVTTIEM